MAKKKDLKQSINCICGDLLAEGVAVSLYGSDKDKDAVKELLSTIIVMRNDFVRRISHPEPGMKAHAYYKKLIDDFNQQVSDTIDQLTNLG